MAVMSLGSKFVLSTFSLRSNRFCMSGPFVASSCTFSLFDMVVISSCGYMFFAVGNIPIEPRAIFLYFLVLYAAQLHQASPFYALKTRFPGVPRRIVPSCQMRPTVHLHCLSSPLWPYHV
uniref:Uncharacterized protein n=1 Tax=Babesia bovis TaxID=5865 RepID=S6B9U9_BABBO|nr:hypothetical protein [Babesia bovis]